MCYRYSKKNEGLSTRRAYSSVDLQAALNDIRSGKLGTRRAAMLYGIPRSTLRNKVYKLKTMEPGDMELDQKIESSPSQALKNMLKAHLSEKACGSRESSSSPQSGVASDREDFSDEALATSGKSSIVQGFMKYMAGYKNHRSKPKCQNEESDDVRSLLLDPFSSSVSPSKNESSLTKTSLVLGGNLDPPDGCPSPCDGDHVGENSVGSSDQGKDASSEKPLSSQSVISNGGSLEKAPGTVASGVELSLKDMIAKTITQRLMSSAPKAEVISCRSGSQKPEKVSKEQEAHYKKDESARKKRTKRGKYRNYDQDSLVEAVRAVQRGEMSVHKAGTFYGVPHSTLEYKVKERHLLRQRKRPAKSNTDQSKYQAIAPKPVKKQESPQLTIPFPKQQAKEAKVTDPLQKWSSSSLSTPPTVKANGIQSALFPSSAAAYPGMASQLPFSPFLFWPPGSSFLLDPNISQDPLLASQCLRQLYDDLHLQSWFNALGKQEGKSSEELEKGERKVTSSTNGLDSDLGDHSLQDDLRVAIREMENAVMEEG